MGWITILLPLLIQFFDKCRENQSKAEILESIRTKKSVRNQAIRRGVKQVAVENGWLDGMTSREKRRFLKNSRREAKADFARIGPLQLSMMVDGAEVAYQVKRGR